MSIEKANRMTSVSSSVSSSKTFSSTSCLSAANLVFYFALCFSMSMGCCVVTSVLQSKFCAFRFDDIINSLLMSGSPTCKWISYANYLSHQAFDFTLLKIFM